MKHSKNARLVVAKATDRVFQSEDDVTTILIGDGRTLVCDVHYVGNESNVHGVGFIDYPESRGNIGDIAKNFDGLSLIDSGGYLQILFDNVESVDVLIGKLKVAREALIADKG